MRCRELLGVTLGLLHAFAKKRETQNGFVYFEQQVNECLAHFGQSVIPTAFFIGGKLLDCRCDFLGYTLHHGLPLFLNSCINLDLFLDLSQ